MRTNDTIEGLNATLALQRKAVLSTPYPELGQREKSLCSRSSHSRSLTLVASAIWSSVRPRCSRIRRRLGPKASRALMPGDWQKPFQRAPHGHHVI